MPREEIANSISHGLGLVLALVAVPVLVLSAMRAGDVRFLIGVSVFGATMVLLYLASTLYHSTTHEAAKQLFRLFDHTAIFLLIAGTYTPFALGVLRGPWGWSHAGSSLDAGDRRDHAEDHRAHASLADLDRVVCVDGLARGGCDQTHLELIPVPGILLILAGGIAYTGGLAFFAAQRIRYNHFIWHLFVIAGTICHYFAVLWYAA